MSVMLCLAPARAKVNTTRVQVARSPCLLSVSYLAAANHAALRMSDQRALPQDGKACGNSHRFLSRHDSCVLSYSEVLSPLFHPTGPSIS